ncbi:MAG: DUF4301 family protein [Flavobacteriaceae bacterium]|nr:DUF4301 family protein [Flavobacteriaceae bacterium]
MISEMDYKHITAQGRSVELVERQLELLSQPKSKMNQLAVATLRNGIKQLSSAEQTLAIKLFRQQEKSNKWIKFIPASGAASRMFAALYEYLEAKKNTDFDAAKFFNTPSGNAIKTLRANLKRFPFFSRVHGYMHTHQKTLAWTESNYFDTFIHVLLDENHLGFGKLPKALIPFFTDEKGREYTAFEAQLEEAIAISPETLPIEVHFTISKEFQNAFKEQEAAFRNQLPKHIAKRLSIHYSYQHPLTDTPVVNHKNEFVRDAQGALLFRKGGHGALLDNLNRLSCDALWLKNIDNIQWGVANEVAARWQEILAGTLISLKAQIFEFLEDLDKNNSHAATEEMIHFIQNQFNPSFDPKEGTKTLHVLLKDYLNRPLRVCGMIKNKGAAGGGPFWGMSMRGKTLQIVEAVELDMELSKSKDLLAATTHFNPVMICCSMSNRKGEKYNLLDFRDEKRYMIAQKNVGAQKIKILEWPGLWNGGMAHWNTVFLEMPSQTFAPVKSYIDLLR